MACLRVMFFDVKKSHKDIEKPVSEVKFLGEASAEDRVITFQEQYAYLAVTSDPLKDVAVLMLETGMRPEEIYKIRKIDLSLEGPSPFIKIPFGKTKAA